MATPAHKLGALIDPTHELRPFFEQVQNKDHWKGPISAWILAEDAIKTRDAIEFFTATEARFGQMRNGAKGWMIHVTAPGYWAGPAN